MKKFLVLLLISTSVFSQKLPLKGKIVDKETKEPVKYANISFLKNDIGTSYSEFGHYWLMADQKLYSEKVHISCLNYKDTIIQAKELHSNIIQLEPKSYKLKEIVISKKVDRELVIDKYKRKDIKTTFGGGQNLLGLWQSIFLIKKNIRKLHI
jgi:hypothetical protein